MIVGHFSAGKRSTIWLHPRPRPHVSGSFFIFSAFYISLPSTRKRRFSQTVPRKEFFTETPASRFRVDGPGTQTKVFLIRWCHTSYSTCPDHISTVLAFSYGRAKTIRIRYKWTRSFPWLGNMFPFPKIPGCVWKSRETCFWCDVWTWLTCFAVYSFAIGVKSLKRCTSSSEDTLHSCLPSRRATSIVSRKAARVSTWSKTKLNCQ